MMMEGFETAFTSYIPDRNPGILNPKFGIYANTILSYMNIYFVVIDYSKNDIKKIFCEDVTNPDTIYTVDLD